MDKNKIILITGGAGFIGSHVNQMLHDAGYRTVVIDNFSTGSPLAVTQGTLIEGDIGDPLDQIFSEYKIDAVMHFAADTDLGESMVHPAKYYHNNVVNTLNLLNAMLRFGIKNLIFSSSAAVYASQESKLDESHPLAPVTPYGQTKLMIEKILHDYDRAYGLKSCSLRYFNAAGGDPTSRVKNYKRKVHNLIPSILLSLLDPEGRVTINGEDYPTFDGTCIRDYVHVLDIANAHILAMEKLLSEGSSTSYNLGNEEGFSIRQVIAAVEKVTNRSVNIAIGKRRPGDPSILVANAGKAKMELGWTPMYPQLDVMIEHAWNALAINYEPSIN